MWFTPRKAAAPDTRTMRATRGDVQCGRSSRRIIRNTIRTMNGNESKTALCGRVNTAPTSATAATTHQRVFCGDSSIRRLEYAKSVRKSIEQGWERCVADMKMKKGD